MRLARHQLINQNSGEFEYYTPLELIEAARCTLNGIDLDPASSFAANKRVKATNIYTIEDDGLKQPWKGKVWLNHPFGRVGNPLWIDKLLTEFFRVNIHFCSITFAATSEKWFRPLMQLPQCFLTPRTNYYLPDGTLKRGVTKGSVITYGGGDFKAFKKNFERFGVIKIIG